jgi:SAM-dependent methyltransferase
MNRERRDKWNIRHQDATLGAPEPSLLELLPLLPRGLALDIAAGAGRNSLALAEAGFKVVAVDFSAAAARAAGQLARTMHLPIMPVIADVEAAALPLRPAQFDLVVNISFLVRPLIPSLKEMLRPGGTLFFDTFLIDQVALGHPSNPAFTLQHYELRELLSDMDLLRYREGLTVYSDTRQAWRATALAQKRD